MLARGGPAGEDDDLADGGGDAGGGWEPWDAPGPGRPGEQDPGPAGFGSGQPFDVLRPGPVLAGAADRVHTGALRRVSDEELTGMIRAWRRLSSWATARELGAIAEFARRRPDEDPGPGTDGDVARRARARRAASNPPEAAAQAAAQLRLPPARRGEPGGSGCPPAERPGQPRRLGVPRLLRLAGRRGNPGSSGAPAAPAGGNPGRGNPGSAGSRGCPGWRGNPAAAGACGGGRPAAEPGFPEVISPFASYELSWR